MKRPRLGFIIEATWIALHSIFAHKMRTFLTLLGIIIGVASVMLVGASIEGLQTYVLDTVSKALGSDSFILAKFARLGEVSQEEWEEMVRHNKNIYYKDLEFIRSHCPDCKEIVGQLNTRQTVYAGSAELYNTDVQGVTANRILLGSQEIEEGRFFTDEEVRRSRFVAVIGSDVYDKFFQGRDPLGEIVKVGPEPFRVVGVLEKLGSSFGQSMDNVMFIPITAYQKIYGTRSSITVRGTAISRDRFEQAVDEVRVAMRIRHKLEPGEEDTFGIISTEDINSSVDQFVGVIAMVVVPITAISLLVGGIVVMNIMLVSVTERTFEIGLRKSLGARRRDIMNQFLIEAFVVAAAGGIVGLLLAWGAALLIEAATPMTMTIRMSYILLSVGVSGGIGIVFGIYPAYTASKLDPIEALGRDL